MIESLLPTSDVGEAEGKAEVDPIPPLICAASNLFWRRAAVGFTDSYHSPDLRSQTFENGKARRQTSKKPQHRRAYFTDLFRAVAAAAEAGGVAHEALRETTESTKPLFPAGTRNSSNTIINWTWYRKMRRLSCGRLCAEICPTASGSPARDRELQSTSKIVQTNAEQPCLGRPAAATRLLYSRDHIYHIRWPTRGASTASLMVSESASLVHDYAEAHHPPIPSL